MSAATAQRTAQDHTPARHKTRSRRLFQIGICTSLIVLIVAISFHWMTRSRFSPDVEGMNWTTRQLLDHLEQSGLEFVEREIVNVDAENEVVNLHFLPADQHAKFSAIYEQILSEEMPASTPREPDTSPVAFALQRQAEREIWSFAQHRAIERMVEELPYNVHVIVIREAMISKDSIDGNRPPTALSRELENRQFKWGKFLFSVTGFYSKGSRDPEVVLKKIKGSL